mmetsp:Transcript_18322/g.38291  ORF Transcript_18322/g.38291 Transcript_18322/m.38291 type:complete len:124 (-) Transcript_18322:1232-1603(-)
MTRNPDYINIFRRLEERVNTTGTVQPAKARRGGGQQLHRGGQVRNRHGHYRDTGRLSVSNCKTCFRDSAKGWLGSSSGRMSKARGQNQRLRAVNDAAKYRRIFLCRSVPRGMNSPSGPRDKKE